MTELERRSRDVLLGLLLISEGQTRNPDAIGAGKPGSRPAVGEESRHDYHRRQIMRARHGQALEEAVAAAEECLRIHKGGEQRHRESIDWERFIVERYPGWSTARVAEAENCQRMQVWRARRKHGVDGSTGMPIAA